MKKLLIYSIVSLQIISVIGCKPQWNKEENIYYNNEMKTNDNNNHREKLYEEKDTIENKNFENKKEKELLNGKGNKYTKPDKKNELNKPETLDKTENIPNKTSK